MFQKAWDFLDGKKTYVTAGLYMAKAIVVYSMNHDVVALLDGLIGAMAIVSGRSVLDKLMPQKAVPNGTNQGSDSPNA